MAGQDPSVKHRRQRQEEKGREEVQRFLTCHNCFSCFAGCHRTNVRETITESLTVRVPLCFPFFYPAGAPPAEACRLPAGVRLEACRCFVCASQQVAPLDRGLRANLHNLFLFVAGRHLPLQHCLSLIVAGARALAPRDVHR